MALVVDRLLAGIDEIGLVGLIDVGAEIRMAEVDPRIDDANLDAR